MLLRATCAARMPWRREAAISGTVCGFTHSCSLSYRVAATWLSSGITRPSCRVTGAAQLMVAHRAAVSPRDRSSA